MGRYSSNTARVFRGPSSAERARGEALRIEPPYSLNVVEKAVSWLWWAVGAGVGAVVTLVVLLWLLT